MGVKDFFCVYVLWINCRIEDGCLWIVKGVLDVKGGYKHPVNTLVWPQGWLMNVHGSEGGARKREKLEEKGANHDSNKLILKIFTILLKVVRNSSERDEF